MIYWENASHIRKVLISLFVGGRCFFSAWLICSTDGDRGLDTEGVCSVGVEARCILGRLVGVAAQVVTLGPFDW